MAIRVTIDESRRQIWEAMRREREHQSVEPELPLQGGNGGGTSGGMEARIARLEASMDHVKSELGRLSGLPVEIARISERLNHMPTKMEIKSEIEAAVDRAGARTQRTVAIVGGLVTIVIAFITYAPKLVALF